MCIWCYVIVYVICVFVCCIVIVILLPDKKPIYSLKYISDLNIPTGPLTFPDLVLNYFFMICVRYLHCLLHVEFIRKT